MHWILQNNLFNEAGYQTLVDTLERLGLPYSVHRVVPFIGEIDPAPTIDAKQVICMGSYSLRHAARQHGWTPGVFDLEPFHFLIQDAHWGEYMLNHGAVVAPFGEARFTADRLFLRPIEDSKVFAGTIMERDAFETWQHKVCALGEDYGDSLGPSTLIQLCPLQTLHTEHRFWVVRGEVVTASTYKIGQRVTYQPLPHDHPTVAFVQARLETWQPHEAFVVDVAETERGMKVVEINTLNSCGFYAADISRLVMALEHAAALAPWASPVPLAHVQDQRHPGGGD